MLPTALGAVAVIVGASVWLLRRSRKRTRTLDEDVLKRFFQDRQQGREVSVEALAGMLGVRLERVRACLGRLAGRGLVRTDGPRLQLTAEGLRVASAVVRSHRVLETYLAERGGKALRVVHRLADRLEHGIPMDRIEAMDRSLGHPVRDPHGDLIPGPGGRLPEPRRVSLALCPAGSVVRVVHVEDEPDAPFRELLAAGVAPAVELEVVASDDAGVSVRVAGVGVCRLEALSAAMVDVVLSDLEGADLRRIARLSELEVGRSGSVVMLTNELRGEARRRLLDLGFTPGAEVMPVLVNALGGDPTAYLIRQSKIALRRDQARCILVARKGDGSGAAREAEA